jgi:hypothetical protein
MKKFLAIAALTAGIAFAPAAAGAQERVGNAAMGAVAGGLVAGPVGAVAGGAIGYTQGRRISRGLGINGRRHYSRRHYRHGRYSHRY